MTRGIGEIATCAQEHRDTICSHAQNTYYLALATSETLPVIFKVIFIKDFYKGLMLMAYTRVTLCVRAREKLVDIMRLFKNNHNKVNT